MKIKEVILNELNKESWFKDQPLTLDQLEDSFDDYFEPYEYLREIDRDSHRWWDEAILVKKIGDKYFMYTWAFANRDEHVYDLGFDFDINSIIEVEPYEETITVTKYREVRYEDEEVKEEN